MKVELKADLPGLGQKGDRISVSVDTPEEVEEFARLRKKGLVKVVQ